MRGRLASFGVFGLVLGAVLIGQTPAPPQTPVFRSGVNLVLVDVVVRDKTGAVVKSLTANDFELFEDGLRQQILTFGFENITSSAPPVESASTLSAAAARASAPPVAGRPVAAVKPEETPPAPLTSENVAGHRLLTLLFDTSSMQPEDVHKAV